MPTSRSVLLFILALVALSFAMPVGGLPRETVRQPVAPVRPQARPDMDRPDAGLYKLDTPPWRRRCARTSK